MATPTISDHSIGITPILIRRAAYYLQLGVGEYTPDHPHFDRVVVSKLYDIQQPDDSVEWALGLIVSFFKNGRRIRWVDFSCRIAGAGGDQILREVQNNE
jgi:hypothetical protein